MILKGLKRRDSVEGVNADIFIYTTTASLLISLTALTLRGQGFSSNILNLEFVCMYSLTCTLFYTCYFNSFLHFFIRSVASDRKKYLELEKIVKVVPRPLRVKSNTVRRGSNDFVLL